MKIILGYPYGELSGIVKIGIEFFNDYEKNLPIQISINGQKRPLNFSIEYLKTKSSVYFGLNTYRVLDQHTGIIEIELSTPRGTEDKLRIVGSNDPNLVLSISKAMETLPLLVPLPIDSRIFATLPEQEFQTNFPEDFSRDGYLVVKNLFSSYEIDSAAMHLDTACGQAFDGYQEGSSARVRLLHLQNGGIQQIFKNQRLRRHLQNMFGVEMIPCQTLSYRYGSQQGPHSDFVHLTSYPQNLMCGVWIALEDVRPGSGELSYFVGSHKEKRLTRGDYEMAPIVNGDYSPFIGTFDSDWKAIAKRHKEERAYLKKGDVLIWDGNLIHAGNPRENLSLTRKSVVLHFFAKGSACYYDATAEIGFAGELRPSL